MTDERKVSASNEKNELKRGIRGWQVAFIGIGGVIGSCYFLGIGACLSSMGPGVLIAFYCDWYYRLRYYDFLFGTAGKRS